MDAHVFRRLVDALSPVLLGARLEKIQSPADQVFVFTIYAQKRKQHLVLHAGRKNPFLYVSQHRPTVAKAPSAPIMRLRKHCVGRRIAACTADWVARRLYILFRTATPDAHPEAQGPVTWLLLDLREGVKLFLGTEPPFVTEDVAWPAMQDVSMDNWREYPVLTPSLRRTLPHLEPLEQQALLLDLEAGGGDIFVYGQGTQASVWAWPCPCALHTEQPQVFTDPLEATSSVGDALVLGVAAAKVRQEAAVPNQREITRLQRLLEKLSTEEHRLQGMAAQQEYGLILQSMLWQLPADAKLSNIATSHADYPELTLDARRTVRENMQAFFHTAGRGRRGLEHLVARRHMLEQQLLALQNSVATVLDGGQILATKEKSGLNLPRGVQAFRSSDGFIILRGKDAKGNGAALRAAAAQDMWLHVEGGPGSHCIIRVHFSGQEIPERTLHEAANLAAVKSWQKDNPSADILAASVRHVKPMRGATPGTVRIDKVALTFRIRLEGDIEARLESC